MWNWRAHGMSRLQPGGFLRSMSLWRDNLSGFRVEHSDGFVVHGQAGKVADGGVDEGGCGDEAVLLIAAPRKPAGEIVVIEQRHRGFAGGVVGDQDHRQADARIAEILGFEGDVEQELGLGGWLGFAVLRLFGSFAWTGLVLLGHFLVLLILLWRAGA